MNKQEDRVSEILLFSLLFKIWFLTQIMNIMNFLNIPKFNTYNIFFYSTPTKRKYKDLSKDHFMLFLMDMLDIRQLITARKISQQSYNHSKTITMIRPQPPNSNKVSFNPIYNMKTKFKFFIFCNCSLTNFWDKYIYFIFLVLPHIL